MKVLIPGVDNDLVMGVLIYISSLDQDCPYTFKGMIHIIYCFYYFVDSLINALEFKFFFPELRLKDIKDAKFCATKNKIIKVLKENGIAVEEKKIKPMHLLVSVTTFKCVQIQVLKAEYTWIHTQTQLHFRY